MGDSKFAIGGRVSCQSARVARMTPQIPAADIVWPKFAFVLPMPARESPVPRASVSPSNSI